MTTENVEGYFSGRALWVDWLAHRICPDRLVKRVDGFEALSAAERALATLHVGIGHILGVADEDLRIEGALTADAATQLISRWWRHGGADPLTSANLVLSWIGLFQLARDTGTARADFLTLVRESQTGQRLTSMTSANLDVSSADDHVLRNYLHNLETAPIDAASFPEAIYSWECSGSHLGIVRALASACDLSDLVGVVTMLELTACYPDSEDDRWDVDALEAAGRMHHFYLSVPGGWPESNAQEVPRWVRDVVTVQGARMWYATSGFVPGWLIVAESDEELRAILRWTYSPAFGVDPSNPKQITFVFPLEFASNDTSEPAYRYQLHDVQLLQWLRTLLAIKLIRLEVYQLDVNGHLNFVFTFGTLLPPELIEKARGHLNEMMPDEADIHLFKDSTPTEWLVLMSQTERNTFASLAMCAGELGTESELGDAYRHHLHLVDAATSASLRGGLFDTRAYAEAKESLQTSISRHPREEPRPLQLEYLGAARGLVQFVVTVDEPVALQAFAAYLKADGEAVVKRFEFSIEIDLGFRYRTIDELCGYLRNGLTQLKSLQAEGVESLVISAGAGIYNLPFHEALMELGFLEVSYTHRVASLAPRPVDPTDAPALVCGYAGAGSNRIASVEVELDIVAALVGKATRALSDTLPSIAHLAGHAKAGGQPYEIGMWLGPADGRPLSSANVLLEVDASAASLVFLSACSSGAGDFPVGELVEAIPLDVAFIEKGARAVVSTAAPVNDQVACFFACVFHDELRRGSSIWTSYAVARQAASTATLGEDRAELSSMLSARWPNWRRDMERQNTSGDASWRMFRVSGRYW
ncbi:MAG: CHAT domain-containing protein [Jatrophihabitantaceae bacterium]